MFNKIQLRERASYSYCARSWRPQTNPSRKKIFSAIFYSRILLLKTGEDFGGNLSYTWKVVSQLMRKKCFPETKLSTRWSVAEGILTLLQHLNHRVENVIKQLVHTSAVRSSRYEARGKFEEHERCVRVAWGVAEGKSSFFRALQTSRVLHILMNARWRMNQLLIENWLREPLRFEHFTT